MEAAGKAGLLELMGIHPTAAVGAIAVDLMLFSGAVATAGAAWVISVPVSIVLAIAVALIQRWGPSRDNVGLAVGKGILIGLLTAIPTPLPSVLTLGLGAAGAVALWDQRKGASR